MARFKFVNFPPLLFFGISGGDGVGFFKAFLPSFFSSLPLRFCRVEPERRPQLSQPLLPLGYKKMEEAEEQSATGPEPRVPLLNLSPSLG